MLKCSPTTGHMKIRIWLILCGQTSSFHFIFRPCADIGIHGEGWSRDDFQTYLKNNGFNDSPELVDTLYNIILQSPGNYLSYAVGGIMFDELRSKAEDTLDDKFDLKEFHKFILDIGPAPFDIIEEKMDIWMENL